jgi:hypothetical protein
MIIFLNTTERHGMTTKQNEIAAAILEAARHLGNGNAATNGVGAIEGYAIINKEGMENISAALNNIAEGMENISDALNNIAGAIDRSDLERPTLSVSYALVDIANAIAGLTTDERR